MAEVAAMIHVKYLTPLPSIVFTVSCQSVLLYINLPVWLCVVPCVLMCGLLAEHNVADFHHSWRHLQPNRLLQLRRLVLLRSDDDCSGYHALLGTAVPNRATTKGTDWMHHGVLGHIDISV